MMQIWKTVLQFWKVKVNCWNLREKKKKDTYLKSKA